VTGGDGTRDAEALLDRYVELLLTWNRKINLTAARTVDEIRRDHIEDCRAVLRHIPPDSKRLLDVGAGGGFPGIVLAIERPALAVTLLEPVQKKRAFLATAARELGLVHVRALAQRLEDHPERDYDVAVSRATWPVPDWLERAQPFVRVGGTVLAMEGRERYELPAGASRHPYSHGDKTRAIIVLVRR